MFITKKEHKELLEFIHRYQELVCSQQKTNKEILDLSRDLNEDNRRVADLNSLLVKRLQKVSIEIASEIFEEIEKNISPMLGLENDKEYVAILSTTFAELKKKYTEGEPNGSK